MSTRGNVRSSSTKKAISGRVLLVATGFERIEFGDDPEVL